MCIISVVFILIGPASIWVLALTCGVIRVKCLHNPFALPSALSQYAEVDILGAAING